jgi:hypothetical protein
LPRRAAANDAPHGLHVDSAELEFDMMSAFDAAMDTGAAAADALPLPMPVAPPEPEPFARDSADDAGVLRHGRREDLVLGEGAASNALDIDVAHATSPRARVEAAAAPPRERRAGPQSPAIKSTDASAQAGPAPLTRAAVIQHAAVVKRSRTLPLLQLFGGICVCVACYWLDSSILFGNASMASVVAQGLALQQLVLGLRGLLR